MAIGWAPVLIQVLCISTGAETTRYLVYLQFQLHLMELYSYAVHVVHVPFLRGIDSLLLKPSVDAMTEVGLMHKVK